MAAKGQQDESAARLEDVARKAYDACHPDDSFEDMKRRARFSKEDRGLLRDWLAYAEQLLADRENGGGASGA